MSNQTSLPLSLSTIENELKHYDFTNATIYLPCDTPNSNFYIYFKKNFKNLNLKELIATSTTKIGYSYNGILETSFAAEPTMFGNPNLYNRCSHIVANPPTCLWKNLFSHILPLNRNLILCGSSQVPTYKMVANAMRLKQLRVGYNYDFTIPTPRLSIGWYTNLAVNRKPFVFAQHQTYQHYDEHEALFLARKADIFKTDAILAVPLSALKDLTDDFEFLGVYRGHINGTPKYVRALVRYNPQQPYNSTT